MKKKKSKFWIITLIVIIIVETTFIYYLTVLKNNTTESKTTTTVIQKQATTQTIQNTLTASAEISTTSTEKLSLNTSRYFKAMCVEENDEVKKGQNILQYTNGTYLTAEYDCLISSYSVPATNSICTSSNYIEVKNLDTLQVTISIDETEISKVSKGQEVEITVNAFEDKTYTGTVEKINEAGTYASSGTSFSAIIKFENDDNIKLGMSASCTIVLEKAENVVTVPIAAIQTKQDKKYVVVVTEDGTTKETTVETGISNDEYVEIKSGISSGETVQMIQTTTTSSGTKSSSGNNKQSGMNFGGMQDSSRQFNRPGGM